MKKLPSTAPCFAKIWTSQPACERARPAAVWFVLLQVLFTMAKSLAQCPEPFNILANPDFEQYTCVAVPPNTTVDGAFNNGCAVQWQAANQTPSICSGTPQSGQLYACLGYSEPPSVVPHREAIFQTINQICQGATYEVTLWHRAQNMAATVRLYMAQGLTPVGINDALAFPINPFWQVIGDVSATGVWTMTTLTFTALNAQNNQLLIQAIGGGDISLIICG